MRPICQILCLCIALLPGGCLASGGDTPSAQAQANVLKPGDTLRITVAGEEELSGGFIVNSNGSVRMELLGAVPADGLSPAAFQEKVRQRLAAGYLKNPQVQVEKVAQAAPPPLRSSQSGQ
jgi:polysaccharide export outer membrane protein